MNYVDVIYRSDIKVIGSELPESFKGL